MKGFKKSEQALWDFMSFAVALRQRLLVRPGDPICKPVQLSVFCTADGIEARDPSHLNVPAMTCTVAGIV